MHLFCHISLLASLLLCVGACGLGVIQAWQGREVKLLWMERTQLFTSFLLVIASLILFWALGNRDFSFVYVKNYTDTFMPMFYALTAFWGGQDGSLLFWELCLAVMGAITIFLPSYKQTSAQVKLYFWMFLFVIQAFFLLLLTGPSNPFLELVPPAAQGNGLNPLLQNPGMIFHPPLLFMGYAGFSIPCCLALAGWINGEQKAWLETGRNWLIVSWILLTAGIILGMWWSYMELGWGGYWAWDPVENASLIPWLSASALVHTAIIGRTQKALYKTNLFLMVLTLLLCFFGTFVVRSGYIDSLHAFGGGGVGTPLLVFMLAGLGLILFMLFVVRSEGKALNDLFSRQGVMLLTAATLGLLAFIVFIGVLWPVISLLWSKNPVGLDAGFYNRVCLPFFALLSAFFAFCPWFSWKQGIKDKSALSMLIGIAAVSGVLLFMYGIKLPVALLGSVSAVVIIFSIILIFVRNPGLRKLKHAWGVYGLHLGLGLMVLGISFSGPYQISKEAIMTQGDSLNIAEYSIKYSGFREDLSEAIQAYEAKLEVYKQNKLLGILTPQKRLYRNFNQTFAEVSVLPGLGNEIYATLLAFDEDLHISLKISINPLVNWLWIGGILACLLPFLCLRRIRGRA